mmetsp:Transcript_98632/g.287706  ORF Transcript_98632/g.287706 Transcript_98632/m.287706 type:complete len:384 (+) Transcript_98632:734-1885(+)
MRMSKDGHLGHNEHGCPSDKAVWVPHNQVPARGVEVLEALAALGGQAHAVELREAVQEARGQEPEPARAEARALPLRVREEPPPGLEVGGAERGRRQQAPPPPAAKPKSCCGSCGVGSFLRGVAAPLVAKHDAELSINPPLDQRTPFLRFNRQRACFRFPAVSMSTVSAARKRHDCSVNDILLAALTGTLRRYGAEVHNDERLRAEDKRLEFKTMLMMALPRKLNEQDMCSSMCNNILFASCPLPIDTADMDERVRRTVEACVDLKSKAYMTGLIGFTNFVKGVAPLSVLRKAASETFSKHTLLVTNVPSTTVPVTFPKEGGAEVDEIQMVFPNVITQVSIITYNGKVCANIVADPALFPRMDDLGAIWESELAMLSGSPGKA